MSDVNCCRKFDEMESLLNDLDHQIGILVDKLHKNEIEIGRLEDRVLELEDVVFKEQ